MSISLEKNYYHLLQISQQRRYHIVLHRAAYFFNVRRHIEITEFRLN